MLTNMMREYYDYTEWANGRVLDAAERLTPQQFLESDLPGIFPIRDSLAHIMISHWAWVERWNGRTPATYPEETDFPDIASIRDFWSEVYAGMRALFERFDDEQLAGDFTYTNFRGEEWTYPLWEELLQVANHSTYHRGEIAALLTRHGASPWELDFLIWRDVTGR
jgi:uncharacterized damage-inducible protein DinB